MTLSYPLRLLLAVLALLTTYVLGTNLAWVVRDGLAGRPGRALVFIRRWGSRVHLVSLVRLAFYLAPPYLVLLYGWASPIDLGLAGLDWLGGLGFALGLGGASLALLSAVWWARRSMSHDAPRLEEVLWLQQPWGWAFVLREAVLMEAWIAMVRSPMLLWAGAYWGVYFGLGAVFLAGWLNAHTRHALRTTGPRERVVLTGSVLIITATLYLFAQNLWLCVALHFVLRWATLWIAGERAEPLGS